MSGGGQRRRFCLVLVKPSHYDDDGYVIQWYRSAIPSNSLAAVYGIAKQLVDERVLGPDTDIDIHAIDETNSRVHIDRIAKLIKAADTGMVMMIGVQSNQVPRTLDLSRPLRAQGIQVGIGGFHMSGVISMLDGNDKALKDAQALGISIFAGEAEGRLGEVLRDANAGTLKPLYNFMKDLPGIEGAPIPLLKRERVRRTAGAVTSFDAGRGCPYQCSFCTIINVQGRVSRRRSPDDIEEIVRVNIKQGLHRFFITDDNFARNKDWEPILDRLIHLREVEKMEFGLIIQVDTLCHKLPNFIDKCRRAGVRRVFIGLENINPANLMSAKKRQNKITEYRKMLLAWKQAAIITYAGYILGFPNDTYESIAHDIEVIKKELPVDLLEFFYLTPLPGSEDHQKLFKAGVPMDEDLNRYDLYHITTAHPKMSREEWARAYQMAWDNYYTPEHVETILRRAVATRASGGNTLFLVTWFKGCTHIENVHPLEGGFLRMKFRHDRRSELPIEPVWKFYPRYWAETVSKQFRWVSMYLKLRRIYLAIKRDPNKLAYMDQALTPVADGDTETLEMFNNAGAQAFVSQRRRLDNISHGGEATGEPAPSVAPAAGGVSGIAPGPAPAVSRAASG